MEKPVDIEERLTRAGQFRLDGNYEFVRKAYRKAARAYNSGLALFGGVYNISQDDQIRLNQIKFLLALNLAQCNLFLNEPKKAIISAKKALEIEPENPKAYFRLAKGNAGVGNYELAEEQLLKVIQLTPNDPYVKKELDIIKVKLKQSQLNSANLFKGIFKKWDSCEIQSEQTDSIITPKSNNEKIIEQNTEKCSSEDDGEPEEDFDEDDIDDEQEYKPQYKNELVGWN